MTITPSLRELPENSSATKCLAYMRNTSSPLLCLDTADALTVKLLNQESSFIKGLWISSLGFSARRGVNDSYCLNPRDYLSTLFEINLVKEDQFIIVDGDNGGQSHKSSDHYAAVMAQAGAAIYIMENKRGAKYNSLDKAAGRLHMLEDREVFASKINSAKRSQLLVAIRLEDAIAAEDARQGLHDAIETTKYYMKHSRPDMFVLHWNSEDPAVVLEFAKQYHELFGREQNVPLLGCIPTRYSKNCRSQQLYAAGYKMIIYANALLRAQVTGIQQTVELLKKDDSLASVDDIFSPIDDILTLMP